MMAYVFPILHRNRHTIYNQNTLHLIGQCNVAMVTDRHFEYANKVVKVSEILFKNVIFKIHGDSGVQHYTNSYKIY